MNLEKKLAKYSDGADLLWNIMRELPVQVLHFSPACHKR